MHNFEEISDKVRAAAIPPRILLSKFKFIDEQSRYSRTCLDPYYLPFYYFLGKTYPVDNIIEIEFGLGLNAACYFMGNPNSKNYLTLQEKTEEYYSPRLGIANIKKVWNKPFYVHHGTFHDKEFTDKLQQHKWNIALVNEKKEYDTYMFWLEALWNEMADDGMIFVNTALPNQERAYQDFCIIKNREQYLFPTRYKIGAVIK